MCVCVCGAQLVVDWLEGLAKMVLDLYPVKVAYFADSICWENTLHHIIHGLDSDRIVTEMVSVCRQCQECVCVIYLYLTCTSILCQLMSS